MQFSFTVQESRDTLREQWAYLEERGINNKRHLIKMLLLCLIVSTALYLLLYFLSDANNYVVLKAVLMMVLALAWIIIPMICAINIFSIVKRKRRFNGFIAAFNDDELSYAVKIDEAKISVTSAKTSHEVFWSEFHYFGLQGETLYLFHKETPMKSIFWNRSNIGADVFSEVYRWIQLQNIKQLF